MKQESRSKKQPKIDPKIAELTEALQRAQADLVNFRTRAEREKSELGDFVKAEVVRELLPLIDNLERALSHVPSSNPKSKIQNLDAWKEWAGGVIQVGKQVQDSLRKMGVERILTVGQPFDPHLHEAVSVDGDKGEEMVSEELRSGYRLGNTVLRHALVKVKLIIKKEK